MLGNTVLHFPNTLFQNECSGIHYFLLGKHWNPESLLIPLFPLFVAKKVGHSYPEPSQAPRVLLRPTPPNVSRAEAHARCSWIWRHLFQGHTGPSRIRACTNNSRGNPFIRPLVESIQQTRNEGTEYASSYFCGCVPAHTSIQSSFWISRSKIYLRYNLRCFVKWWIKPPPVNLQILPQGIKKTKGTFVLSCEGRQQ